jgi:hypothetical protein
MSKLLLSVILSAGLFFQASAQVTFNKRFDLFNEGRLQDAGGLYVDSSGQTLLAFSSGYQSDLGQIGSTICTALFDQEGSFSEGYRFELSGRATYGGWVDNLWPRAEGGYIIGGSASDPDTSRAALYWLDEAGVVEDFKVFYELSGDSWIGRQARQLPDSGFVFVGETSTQGVVDAFLMRTNAAGDIQWLRTYGASDNLDFINSVIPLPNGEGYLLGGVRYVTGVSAQLWALRLDTLGDVLWEQTWGGVYEEGVAHLVLTQNGEVMVSSGWGSDINVKVYPYRAGLDLETGEVLWSNFYGYDCVGCAFFSAVEDTLRGGVVSVGDSYVGQALHGMILKTTSTGDSLWMYKYQYVDDQVPAGPGRLRDVALTPDGGYIAVGRTLSVPGIYSQDVWVIKVDSMGCLEPGCHLLTGIESQVTNLQGALTVAPNPVRSGEAVQVSISLPPSITPQGPLRLTVVSSEGRVVQEQIISSANVDHHLPSPSLRAGVSAFSFDLSSLSTGLYHLHLSDGARWLAGAKVVVE